MTADPLDRWQHIATAPKDGRWVRLGWIANGRLELEKISRWRSGQWTGGWTPTHWLPPTESKGE